MLILFTEDYICFHIVHYNVMPKLPIENDSFFISVIKKVHYNLGLVRCFLMSFHVAWSFRNHSNILMNHVENGCVA